MKLTNGLIKFVAFVPSKKIRAKLNHWIHLKTNCEMELKDLTRILPRNRRRAIDAGANVGHYSIELSKFFNEVIAFEINEDLISDLFTIKRNITIINEGLSSKISSATLYIPLLNGELPLTGWGSLQLGNCSDTNIHQEKEVSIKPLDYYNFENVDFIKIDVEGHEVELLEGAKKTIKSYNPTVLIEIKEKNLEEVRNFFCEMGYVEESLTSIYNQLGSENYLFVPLAEKDNKTIDRT